MKIDKLDRMVKGWFVGDFSPVVLKSEVFEVAYKTYKKGDYESMHVHHVATEITLLAHGSAEMNGVKFTAGDIITLEPGKPTDFRALEDCATVVVKTPSAKNDKFLVDPL